MTYNLFALSSNPANRIVRFPLSRQVQAELTSYLQTQESQFESAASQEVIFDGKYKPDEGEALVIENYDDIDRLGDAVSSPMGIQEVSPSTETYASFRALFSGYINANGETVILIQSFDRRKIISTDGLSIFHSSNVYKRIEGIGLTLDFKLSAMLVGNRLRFFSFHAIRQIFDLSEYYREATDSDITEFANNPSVKVNNLPILISIADSWTRRKFALIQQSQILETVPMNEIKAVATEFNIPLDTMVEGGDEKILLPTTKKELKTILRFLDEDYYKSPLSKTLNLTNSKRPADTVPA